MTDSVTPELLSALCHELRGPLGALGNWVHVLSAPEADAATRARALSGIKDDVRAMSAALDLVSTLGSVLSAPEAARAPVEVESLLHRLVDATPGSRLAVSTEGDHVVFILTFDRPPRFLPLALARALGEHPDGELSVETSEREARLRFRRRF